MKQINNRLNRTWYGGGASGGGGGGGCCYELVTEAALQALQAGLAMVQGTMYQITDVTPDWQVVVLAESTSTIATQGQGIYQNLLFTDVEYNLNLGLLQRVYDPLYNNEVVGELNIFEFLWNNPDWTNNKITGSSSIFLTGAAITEFNYNVIDNSVVDLSNAAMDFFTYNNISENSVLTASAATFTAISGNIVSGQGTLSLDSTTSIGAYYNSVSSASFLLAQNATIGGSITYNTLKGNSTISLSFATLVSSIEGNNLSSGASIGGGVTTSLDSITKNNLSSSSYIDLTGFIDATCAIAENNLDADSFISLTGVNAIPSISKNNLSSNASINDGGFGGITITNGIVGNSVTYGDIVLYTCTINQVLANVINVGTLSFVRAVCTGKIEANTAHRGTMVFGNTAGSGAFIEIKANTVAGGYQDTGNLVVYGNVTMGNTIYNNTILGGSDINLQDVVNVTNGILYNSLDGLSRIRFKNGCSLAIIEGNTLTGESKIRDNNAGFVDIASGIVNNTLTNGSDILCQLAVLSGGLNQNNLSNGIFKLISGTFTDVMANTFINSSADFTAASNGSLSNNKFTNVANLNCTGGFSFANFDYNTFLDTDIVLDFSGGSNIQAFTNNYISNPITLFEVKVANIPVFTNNQVINCDTFSANLVSMGNITSNSVLDNAIFNINGTNQIDFEISQNSIDTNSSLLIDATATLIATGSIYRNTIKVESVLDFRGSTIYLFYENIITNNCAIDLGGIATNLFHNNSFCNSTYSCPTKSVGTIANIVYNEINMSIITIGASANINTFTLNQLYDGALFLNKVGVFSHNTVNHGSQINADDLSDLSEISFNNLDNNSFVYFVNTIMSQAFSMNIVNNSSNIQLTNFTHVNYFTNVTLNNTSQFIISDVNDIKNSILYINIDNSSSFTVTNSKAIIFNNPMQQIFIDNASIVTFANMVTWIGFQYNKICNNSSVYFDTDTINSFDNNEINNQSTIFSNSGTVWNSDISYNNIFHSYIDLIGGRTNNDITHCEINDSFVTFNTCDGFTHNYLKNAIVEFANSCIISSCQILNLTATIKISQSNKQAIGNVMSNMEADVDMAKDYDAGTVKITFDTSLKDYIGVFNCINAAAGTSPVEIIVNAPTSWSYKMTNQTGANDVRIASAATMIIPTNPAFGNIRLNTIYAYAILKDIGGGKTYVEYGQY